MHLLKSKPELSGGCFQHVITEENSMAARKAEQKWLIYLLFHFTFSLDWEKLGWLGWTEGVQSKSTV